MYLFILESSARKGSRFNSSETALNNSRVWAKWILLAFNESVFAQLSFNFEVSFEIVFTRHFESKNKVLNLAGRTENYGPLYWPITARVLTERYNKFALLIKREVKIAGYWPSSFFFWVFMDRDEVEVYKNAKKKERGQYPAILTENKLGQ